MIDITDKVNSCIQLSDITDGIINISCPGSTSAIITTEYEPLLTKDNKRIIEQLIPKGDGYHHDRIDNNAHSHLRATILSCEKTIPVVNNQLLVGTWQQIVFVDLDVRPRRRRLIFQLIGVNNNQ